MTSPITQSAHSITNTNIEHDDWVAVKSLESLLHSQSATSTTTSSASTNILIINIVSISVEKEKV